MDIRVSVPAERRVAVDAEEVPSALQLLFSNPMTGCMLVLVRREGTAIRAERGREEAKGEGAQAAAQGQYR